MMLVIAPVDEGCERKAQCCMISVPAAGANASCVVCRCGILAKAAASY